ncbi:hypothetical protein BH11PSE8_BH11PSE8_14360 [soil metagenome]
MIYKFKSKADGDLIMTKPVGDRILQAIGKTPAAQGIIEPSALPAAIAAIEAAVAAEEDNHQHGGQTPDDGDDTAHARGIGFRQHAWPMLQMMKRAQAEDANIVWGV